MSEKELAEIVGIDNVLSDKEFLEEYSGDLSFALRKHPRCIVRPADVEEVRRVVKWANETRTPLVPVSSGAPHFRGDTVPGADGSVIVDLSKMDRIIRVDSANMVAIVEPGVTFGGLQKALNREGICAYLPLAPRPTKSVIGSVLEKEPVTVPAYHWDSADPLLCTEIVFGTGDKLRTGEAAGPDNLEGQWEIGKAQMSPFGPTQMDVHRLLSGAQGTIGIVTWASLKCRSLPKVTRSFFVPSDNLSPLIDLYYGLVRARMGEQIFILNGLNLACLLGGTAPEICQLREILPAWVMFVSFEGYGRLPDEKVRYQEADLLDMSGAAGLRPAIDVPGASAEELARLLSYPPDGPYWKTKLKGGFQDVFFLTTLDRTPGFASDMEALLRKDSYPLENIGVYIQAIVQGTSCHCEFDMYYDPSSPAEPETVKRLLGESAAEMENRGGFFSRPYPAWAEIAYRHAGDTASVQRKIKMIFDPSGILNPGKLCF